MNCTKETDIPSFQWSYLSQSVLKNLPHESLKSENHVLIFTGYKSCCLETNTLLEGNSHIRQGYSHLSRLHIPLQTLGKIHILL